MSIEGKADSVSSIASYATNGTIFVYGTFTLNHLLMIIGTVFAVATYFTSRYYNKRRDQREREYHKHRMGLSEGAESAVKQVEQTDDSSDLGAQ